MLYLRVSCEDTCTISGILIVVNKFFNIFFKILLIFHNKYLKKLISISNCGKDAYSMVQMYFELNQTGREKALERIQELTKISDYTAIEKRDMKDKAI